MSYILAVLAIAVPLGIGALLLHRMGFPGSVHKGLWLGASYGVGLTVVSLVLGVLPLLKIPLSVGWVVPVVMTVGVALWLSTGRFPSGMAPRSTSNDEGTTAWLRTVWWIGLGCLVFKLGLIGIRTVHKPVMGWDAGETHSLRAKALFHEQTILPSTWKWIGSPDYPPGIPLLELWVTLFQGGWDDTAIKILFPGFLIALLAMLYGVLRETLRPLGALAGVWMAASLPLLAQHATDAYLDLPLAYTTLGVSVFLWRYSRTGRIPDLLVASLMAAFGIWIKREGFVAFGIALGLLGLWMWTTRTAEGARRGWVLGVFAAMPLLVWASWAGFQWIIQETVPLSFQPTSLMDVFARSFLVVSYAGAELWTSRNWNVLWPIFAGLWLVHVRRSFTPDVLFFAWPVLLTLGVFLAVSASTEMGEYLEKGNTLHRMVLHVAPLAVVFVALMFGDTWAGLGKPRNGPSGRRRHHRASRLV